RASSAVSVAAGWTIASGGAARELRTNQPRAAPSSRPMTRPTNKSVMGSAELMLSLSHTRPTKLSIALLRVENVFEKISRLLNFSLWLIRSRVAGHSVDIDKLLESITNAIIFGIGDSRGQGSGLHIFRKLREQYAAMRSLSLVVAPGEVASHGREFDVAGFLFTGLKLQHILDVAIKYRDHGSGRNREESADEIEQGAANRD